jgi:hypothetical protein
MPKIFSSSSWAQTGERGSKTTVGERLDAWRQELAKQGMDGTLSQLEQACLSEFLQVLANLRPHLVQCYDQLDFPRTNNELERSIRALKMQYRRGSFRKNWNNYLLPDARYVAYATWWEQDAVHRQQLEQRATRLDRAGFRQVRRETTCAPSEQRKRFRFRHKRQQYLTSLETRWAAAAST